MLITVSDFEEKVWKIEGIRLVLRANPDSQVTNYDYKNAAQEGWSVTEFLEKRISGHINGIPVIVIQGDGEEPHGRVLLRTLRGRYKSL